MPSSSAPRSAHSQLLSACLLLLSASALCGCAYLDAVATQRSLKRELQSDARLRTAKHLLDRSFFVYGIVDGPPGHADESLFAIALSSDLQDDEIVDICREVRVGSFYGLHLPAGEYRILAVADRDGDGRAQDAEVLAGSTLSLDARRFPQRVAANVDLSPALRPASPASPIALLEQPPSSAPREESLYYPKGTLRSLNDPIFAPSMASLGLYHPAAFMEAAPLMFYALEEETGYKTPVIFVHGIGGSAASFAPIVEAMDRQRYAPWFFHYPSSMDLEQLSALFYDIFLSGKVIPASQNGVAIVAHSMGGLVAREALNRMSGAPEEPKVALLVTVASPFAGMPAASRGVSSAPVVLPAWRNLDPSSPFVARIFRRELPPSLPHHAFICARSERQFANERGDDGVVSLASQLRASESGPKTQLHRLVAQHAAVLNDPEAVEAIARLIGEAPNPTPPDYLARLLRGGYEIPAADARYNPLERHFLRVYGRLMLAVARGDAVPVGPFWERFVAVAQGRLPAELPAEIAWQKFAADYPELLDEAP